MRLLTTSCNHRVLIPSLSSAYFSARFHVLPPLPRLGTNLYKCSLDLLHILVIYRLPHRQHLPGCCYGTCQHGHRGAHLVIGKLYLLGLFHLIQLVSLLCCSKCHVSLSLASKVHAFEQKPGMHQISEKKWSFVIILNAHCLCFIPCAAPVFLPGAPSPCGPWHWEPASERPSHSITSSELRSDQFHT